MDRQDDASPPKPVAPEIDAEAMDHLDDDVCTDVAAGLVAPAKLKLILSHVDACPECERRLMAAAGDREFIRSKAEAEGWAGAHGNASVSSRQAPAQSARSVTRLLRNPRFALPLALAAGLLIFFLARPSDVPPRADLAPYWIPATGELLKLRSAHPSDADSLFWAGLGAYERHDTAHALALLEASRAGGGLDDLRALHLASLLINAGRAGETLKLLKELEIDTLPMPWREDASWMEYLALIRLRRTDEAAARLKLMATWPGRVGDLARGR